MKRVPRLRLILGAAVLSFVGTSLAAWALPTCWDCFNFQCKSSLEYFYANCEPGGGPGSQYCVAGGECQYY